MARGFEAAWWNAVHGQRGGTVAPQAEVLARALYFEALRRPVDRQALRTAIEAILRFLTSPEGRTDANCWAFSLFLEVGDDWEGNWQDVPDDLFRILARMSAEMYRTVSDPLWTANYGALPEQLLSRLLATGAPNDTAR